MVNILNKSALILLILVIGIVHTVSGNQPPSTLNVIPQGGSFYHGQKNLDVSSAIPNGTVGICWWDSYGIRWTPPRFGDCRNGYPGTSGDVAQLSWGEWYALPQNDPCVTWNGYSYSVACVPFYTTDPSIYTRVFTVLEPPTPVSSFTATPTSGPAPLTVQFADTSSNNPDDWYWQFGDGTTSSLQNPPRHTYTLSGVFIVTMKAKNTNAFFNRDNPANTTITVLSPLPPGTTTSPTPSLTQTTAISTTTTTATSTPIATTIQTAEPTTSSTTPLTTSISTPTSSRTQPSKVTLKTFTPYPTDTPPQPSPLGAEIGIIATIGAALLVMKRK